MWQQWINGILGLWIVLLPFIGIAADSFTWTLVGTGVAIAILGFWGAASHRTEHEGHRENRTHYTSERAAQRRY